MDNDDSDSKDLGDINGDTGTYNSYCITFTLLVKRNLHTTFAFDKAITITITHSK